LQYISRTGVSNQRYSYDSLGRLTASWTDTDSDGVMDTNENRKVYTWTYTGLLKQANVYTNSGGTLTTVNYIHDESGTGLLRERNVVSGTSTRFHWEGMNLYLEEEKSGTTWYPKRAYVNQPSGLGGTVARFDLGTNYQLDSSDSGYFYYYDEAGNVILIVDKTGAVTDQFEQDCWGNDLNSTFSSTRAIKQHQTNKYLDETTGLYFFGARWYDPAIGRFISVSPLAPIDEEEYVYCGNDPVDFIDATGSIKYPLQNNFNITTDINSHYNNLARMDPSLLIRPKDKSPSQIKDELKDKATKTHGGQVCAAIVDGFGNSIGFTPFEGYYDLRDPLTKYSFAGAFFFPYASVGGGIILRPFNASSVVTMWYPEGGEKFISQGRWVMIGGGNLLSDIRNYIFSAIFHKYSFSNRVTVAIENLPGQLAYPPTWEHVWKGLLGQRMVY
jgi:RHS repeat-associated protein